MLLLYFFNRELDKRQAVNTRLSSPSEASVITKPHRMVKKKVCILQERWTKRIIFFLVCIHTFMRWTFSIFNKMIACNIWSRIILIADEMGLLLVYIDSGYIQSCSYSRTLLTRTINSNSPLTQTNFTSPWLKFTR